MTKGTEPTTNEMEARVARRERLLFTGPGWTPEPGNIADEGLWRFSRDDAGRQCGPNGEPYGIALLDVASRNLRPNKLRNGQRVGRLISSDVQTLLHAADDFGARIDQASRVLRAPSDSTTPTTHKAPLGQTRQPGWRFSLQT